MPTERFSRAPGTASPAAAPGSRDTGRERFQGIGVRGRAKRLRTPQFDEPRRAHLPLNRRLAGADFLFAKRGYLGLVHTADIRLRRQFDALVDHGAARFEREQHLAAADAAVEAREAVIRFGHTVVERGVAARDLIDGNPLAPRKTRGFAVLAVGVDRTVVRRIVMQLGAAR